MTRLLTWMLLLLAMAGTAHADDLNTREMLAQVRGMIAQQETNVQRMRDELKRNPNRPDAKLLRNSFATATGGRSDAYRAQTAYMQKLIDAFEGNLRRNVGGAVVLASGGASARAQFIVEMDRSIQFIAELRAEERRLAALLAKEGAPHVVVEVVDFDTGKPIPGAIVTIRKAGGSVLATGDGGETRLLKGTHIPDGATVPVDIAVSAKGYKEVWQTIEVDLLKPDTGRYLVQLTRLADVTGTWHIDQTNSNGAIYTGTWKLTQTGTAVAGEAEWSNHVHGKVAGEVKDGKLVISIRYAGGLVGYYNAKLDGSQLKDGGCRANKGTATCGFVGKR